MLASGSEHTHCWRLAIRDDQVYEDGQLVGTVPDAKLVDFAP